MIKTSWKKMFCILMCFALLVSLFGCSKSSTDASYVDSVINTEDNDSVQSTVSTDGNSKKEETGAASKKATSTSKNSSKNTNSKSTDESKNTTGKYDPSSLKGKTITIMRSWGPYASGNNTAHDNWNKRVAELEKKYQFDIVEKKWSATLDQEVLSGVMPAGQLYQVNGDWVANYARQGFIASWDDAMKATGIDMTSDVYLDFSVQLCNYNNKQYAIGVEEGKMMAQVVYNKKLTSEFADIEKLMDENKWTWEAMTDIAKKVKAKYPSKWGIGMDKLLGVYGMVASNGGQLVSVAKDGTLGSNLNDKKVQEALNQIYSWIHTDKVALINANTTNWDYMLKELINGNIAFTFNEDACYDVLKAGMNADDYGIAYLPMGPSAREYYACMESSWPYVVPKAYEDQAADLLFVVDALYQFHPGYNKDTQFRDLYIRKFSNNVTYNRVKNMHRKIKAAPIIEIQLGSTTAWSNAMSQLYQGKTTVGALIDSRQSEFDAYMKDTWNGLKFTGKIN